MADIYRKCAKCGRSQLLDSIKIHKFPKIINDNPSAILRTRVWAEYCYPNKQWTVQELKKLNAQKYLCSNHFAHDYGSSKRLSKHAIPIGMETTFRKFKDEQINSLASRQRIPLQELHHNSNNIMVVESVSVPQDIHTMEIVESEPSAVPQQINSMDVEESIPIVEERKKTTATDDILYLKCRKQIQEIYKLRRRLKSLKVKESTKISALAENKNVQKLLKYNISDSCALLLQSQLKNCPRKSNGRRWTVEEKVLALSMYKKSPASYRLLRRMFCLPTQNTLKTLLNKMPMACGINRQVMDALKKLPSAEDRMCVLMFDEMSIRRNVWYNPKTDRIEGFEDHGAERTNVVASNALVFMLAGLRKKWKQPVAHFFVGDKLNARLLSTFLNKVLSECFDAGMEVMATICDMNQVNVKCLNDLGSTRDEPSFDYMGHKIVTIFDPPHLLKCLRNMLMKYDLECPIEMQCGGKGVAKWSHIQDFYHKDNGNHTFVFAPALTAQHIEPRGKQKMKVKLAAQVLSHSVAAGMFAKIGQNELTPDAATTATLIARIDKLFDCLNGDTPSPKSGKIFLTNFTQKSPHIKFIGETIEFFKSIRFLKSGSPPPSVDGWVRTLNGVLKLWEIVKSKNIKSMSTKRLNQDPLENCFGSIRANCGFNPNPTVGQFVAGMKTTIVNNLTHIGNSRNCLDDDNDLLVNVKNFFKASCSERQDVEETINDDDLTIAEAANNFEITEGTGDEQACAYVSGFVLKKLKSNCVTCLSLMESEEIQVSHLFTTFKEYRDNKKSLRYAQQPLTNSMQACANIINNYLKANPHAASLKQKIRNNIIANVNFDFLNSCADHKSSNIDFIIKSAMAICVKRYCVVENRKFVDEATRKAWRKRIMIYHNYS